MHTPIVQHYLVAKHQGSLSFSLFSDPKELVLRPVHVRDLTSKHLKAQGPSWSLVFELMTASSLNLLCLMENRGEIAKVCTRVRNHSGLNGELLFPSFLLLLKILFNTVIEKNTVIIIFLFLIIPL